MSLILNRPGGVSTSAIIQLVRNDEMLYRELPAAGDLKPSMRTSNHGAWLLCNGVQYREGEYPELYRVLSGVGGLFNVPDLRNRAPYGADTALSLGTTDGRVLASRGPNHTLTSGESGLPQHYHDLELIDQGGAPPTATTGTQGQTGSKGATTGGGGTRGLWITTTGAFDFGLAVGGVDNGAQDAAEDHDHGWIMTNWFIHA